jgi:hypothetical protein
MALSAICHLLFAIQFGHRIVATWIERMTTANPFDGQPTPLQNPIFADGFVSIVGATWFKSASGGKERRNEPLISPNQYQYHILHYSYP